MGVKGNGYGVNRSRYCTKEIGGKLSGVGEGEPHPASGQVDEGREVLSTIEEERDEVVEMVVAS